MINRKKHYSTYPELMIYVRLRYILLYLCVCAGAWFEKKLYSCDQYWGLGRPTPIFSYIIKRSFRVHSKRPTTVLENSKRCCKFFFSHQMITTYIQKKESLFFFLPWLFVRFFDVSFGRGTSGCFKNYHSNPQNGKRWRNIFKSLNSMPRQQEEIWYNS